MQRGMQNSLGTSSKESQVWLTHRIGTGRSGTDALVLNDPGALYFDSPVQSAAASDSTRYRAMRIDRTSFTDCTDTEIVAGGRRQLNRLELLFVAGDQRTEVILP